MQQPNTARSGDPVKAIIMGKPTYQELEIRIQELESESLNSKQIEAKLLEQRSTLREQNIKLVKKSIELSDVMRELEDRNYELGEAHQEIVKAQNRALQELSTPIIPIMDRIIVMPLIGSIDSMRTRDIMRTLLAGIRTHRAKVVILDITGVPVVDSGVANHLSKTIQAARLKGTRTIVTGISDAVAEIIVDLGLDWSSIETLSGLQTGLIVALNSLGIKLVR
ncbi:MAG: STAS domain-containing protein [Chloroflexi bacterium]|nr:STAS domain-containing protein [Chloroflexota bacterium]